MDIDELDAEAIAEAATRPTMQCVTMKSQPQSDIQALRSSAASRTGAYGLTPRQMTTGGKPRLLGIRKGGNAISART
jgi:hypothetical protein